MQRKCATQIPFSLSQCGVPTLEKCGSMREVCTVMCAREKTCVCARVWCLQREEGSEEVVVVVLTRVEHARLHMTVSTQFGPTSLWTRATKNPDPEVGLPSELQPAGSSMRRPRPSSKQPLRLLNESFIKKMGSVDRRTVKMTPQQHHHSRASECLEKLQRSAARCGRRSRHPATANRQRDKK